MDSTARDDASQDGFDISSETAPMLDAVERERPPLSAILEETQQSDPLLNFFIQHGYARRQSNGSTLLTSIGEQVAGPFIVGGGSDGLDRGTPFKIGDCCRILRVTAVQESDADHLRVAFNAEYLLNALGTALIEDPSIASYLETHPGVITGKTTFPYEVPFTRFSDGWRIAE